MTYDTSNMTDAEVQQAITELEQAQWGKWEAKGPIYIDGVLAFAKGHDVPVHHVEKFHLEEQGLVKPYGDETADVIEEPAPAPEGQVIEANAKPAKAPKVTA
jgi:hypothetical protein